jgi:hypothetical protein
VSDGTVHEFIGEPPVGAVTVHVETGDTQPSRTELASTSDVRIARTVYEVIGAPPFEPDGTQVTATLEPDNGKAVTPVGPDGTVEGVTGSLVPDGPGPLAFVARTATE